MEAGHPSLYLVYDYMEGGDLGRALAIPPGSHGALTQGERFKVCVCVCCASYGVFCSACVGVHGVMGLCGFVCLCLCVCVCVARSSCA